MRYTNVFVQCTHPRTVASYNCNGGEQRDVLNPLFEFSSPAPLSSAQASAQRRRASESSMISELTGITALSASSIPFQPQSQAGPLAPPMRLWPALACLAE